MYEQGERFLARLKRAAQGIQMVARNGSSYAPSAAPYQQPSQ
jgi:hypothetical protein